MKKILVTVRDYEHIKRTLEFDVLHIHGYTQSVMCTVDYCPFKVGTLVGKIIEVEVCKITNRLIYRQGDNKVLIHPSWVTKLDLGRNITPDFNADTFRKRVAENFKKEHEEVDSENRDKIVEYLRELSKGTEDIVKRGDLIKATGVNDKDSIERIMHDLGFEGVVYTTEGHALSYK